MSEIGEKLINAVREVAQEMPNKVVMIGGCQYFDENRCPSCIIGFAMTKLNLVPGEDFAVSESWNHQNLTALIDGSGPFSEFKELSEKEGEWLFEVQMQQDGQIEWAEAVSNADKNMGINQ